MSRISSSILRSYIHTMYNESKEGKDKFLDFSNQEITNVLKNTDVGVRLKYLNNAQNNTYKDEGNYQTFKTKPYLTRGIIFERLLTGKLDVENDLITYDHLRGKINGELRSVVLEKRCLESPEKLPISEKDFDKIDILVKNIHRTPLSGPMQDVTGFDTLGSLFFSDTIMYSYKLEKNVLINGRQYTMTGECDAVLPLENGKHMIFEFKTSSKMYYPNHINKIIQSMNYDFQVMFYTYLLKINKMKPIKYVTFVMANPSNRVYKYLPFDVTEQKNKDKFNKIIKSL